MNTKQTIAIIGAAGSMGSGIAKSLAKGNYRLLLCGRDSSKLQVLSADISVSNANADVEVLDCSSEASWEADIIILAVPYNAEREIAEAIREVVNQKIVVSISNPLNATFDGLLTAPDLSAAEELQAVLPNSKIVKAFNTVFAADFVSPVIDGRQADVFVAANSEDALQTVSELAATAGFNPVAAGSLSVSRTLESMALLLIQLNMKHNYNWLAGWKILHN